MKNIRKVLIEAAKTLARTNIGPIRLSQTLHLPLGPLYIISVGDLQKGILPSDNDIVAATSEIKRQDLRLNGKSKSWSVQMLMPPFVKVKEVFLIKGTLYIVSFGDLEKNILPTTKDLKELRDRFSPALAYLGLKRVAAIFYPPILEIKPTRYPGLDCVLGSKNYNIMPDAKDIKRCRELVHRCSKDLGVKFKHVRVESALHKNFKD